MENVLVCLPRTLNDERKAKLIKSAGDMNLIFVDEKITDEQYEKADIILGNIPSNKLSLCKNLKWLQLNSAGVDSFVGEGVVPKHVLLTNSTGCYGVAISEYMIGATLALMKRLHQYRDKQHKHDWSSSGHMTCLYGAKVVTVGLGDIGSHFAKRVKALGGYNIAFKTSTDNKPEYVDELYTLDDLDRVLPTADVVAIATPNTPKTMGLFNRERLNLMKKGSYLVNIARGKIADTEAICDLLNSSHLAGAALDVTMPEPLPKGHRLWDCENAIITPHVSGGYNAEITNHLIIEHICENLNRYKKGEKLLCVVDLNAGYAKKK